MTNKEINAELSASDNSNGWSEVVDRDALQPVSAPVELSAAIIDAAYNEMMAATREHEAFALHVVDKDEVWTPEEKIVQKLEVAVDHRIQLAKIEVDRVTALQNWLQVEAIYKSIGG